LRLITHERISTNVPRVTRICSDIDGQVLDLADDEAGDPDGLCLQDEMAAASSV